MLKNKSKEQLLELLYQAKNENFNLQTSSDKQAEILKSIAELYHPKGFFSRLFNFFALPWRVLQTLKTHNEYFYTIQNQIEMANLTKEQCIAAQKAIVQFETKKISTDDYQILAAKMLGLDLKTCATCTDVAGRLHDDFQKRVSAEIVAKYPELLPTPPALQSGQFRGEHYQKWMQTYHFKGLIELLSRMKTAALNAKQRGAMEQSKLMLADCELLKAFIEARKAGQSEIEKITGVVDLGVEAIEGDVETFDLPDEEIADFVNGTAENEEPKTFVELFGNENQEQPNASKEKKVYTDEEAYALKNGGMTLAELGVYYGIDTSTVQRKLKKYELMLAVDETDEVL
jgi:hypothetical protein